MSPTMALLLINTQPQPTPQPFQAKVQIGLTFYLTSPADLLKLQFSLTPDFSEPLYAWIEDSDQYFTQIVVWLKLPAGIPANSYVQIYYRIADTVQYPYTGISPVIAQKFNLPISYDNGSLVFNYYQSFAGNSLPSGWNVIPGTQITYNNYYITVAVGSSGGIGGAFGIYTTLQLSPPYTFEFYGKMNNTTPSMTFIGFDQDPSQAFGAGYPRLGCGYAFVEGVFYFYPTDMLGIANGCNIRQVPIVLDDEFEKVYTLMLLSPTQGIVQLSYTNVWTGSLQQKTPTTLYILVSTSRHGSTPAIVYFVRIRQTPPHGIMPIQKAPPGQIIDVQLPQPTAQPQAIFAEAEERCLVCQIIYIIVLVVVVKAILTLIKNIKI